MTKKRPTCSTQDLKERGWTGAMIRDLLGQHDRERANEMRVGSRNRRLDAPVKLYLRDRVEQAETTEAFARAQEQAREAQDRAGKAVETRQQNAEKQIQAYIEAYTLTLTPPEGWEGMTDQQRWSHHLDELFTWEMDHDHLLKGLSRADRRQGQNAVFEKHWAAVHVLYPKGEA